MRDGWRQTALGSLAVAIACGLAAWGGIALTIETERIAAIWVANGLLLGLLLVSEPRVRPYWIIAAWTGNVAANLLNGDAPLTASLLALCNTLEVLIALRATSAVLRRAADLLKSAVLWRFFFGALILAPAVSGACGAVILFVLHQHSLLDSFRIWFAADALGIAVMTPLVLALRPSELIGMVRTQSLPRIIWPLALACVVAMFVFAQSTYPFVFMVLPPLLLVALRLGFSGAAICVFLIACIALVFTIQGTGPFTLVPDQSMTAQVVALQCLLATMIVTSYPLCSVLAVRQQLLTEVAASGERFRAIAENSNDIIVVADRAGVRQYVSPAVETILGFTADEIVGTKGAWMVHPDDVARFAAGVKQLSQGHDRTVGSFRMRRKDGEYVWLETSTKQLRDSVTGELRGWLSTVRDISARKRVDRLKDEFISTVSHELRTPLTSLLGALGLVASGQFDPSSPKVTRLIDMAKANGERLARLVNDILDFEKLSSGAMRLDPRPCSVDEIVQRAVAANQHYGDRLGVTFRTHLAAATHIHVDPDRFEQVLANLLSNAAKFSHRGGVVDVSTSSRQSRCVISVRDYGIGIPAAFKQAIFDRFSQADSSDQRARGGTGLGMAIAKHLTEQMGGALSFESEEGAGTVFHVEFSVLDLGSRTGTSGS